MDRKLTITHFGETHEVMLNTRDTYSKNGNLAVKLFCADGPFATLSVNTDMKLPPNQFVAKTYSENETLNEQLIAYGIFKRTGKTVQCGYVECPILELVEVEQGK